jgi:hypothetical protein
MPYQKHELLGTNKDGSTPKRGPRTIHKTTEPIAHDHSRDYETVAGTGNIARDSTAHKRSTVEVHSGMHRTQGTNEGAPVTSSLIDDEKMSLDPVVSGNKIGKAVPPVPGQRSRTQASEVTPCAPGAAHAASALYARDLHAARHANADAIIGEGVMMAGDPNHFRHPANLRRR